MVRRLAGGVVMVAATSTEVAFPLLSMLIVVPVVGALLIAVLSNRRPEYSKLVALLASVGTGALVSMGVCELRQQFIGLSVHKSASVD
jgi:NADH:ubiquinone oxidoreductase subunit 4 (subunit M)